jgi:hypothetical protein
MADLVGFAHQLLICLAAITLAGVLTTPRRYDRVDACSAHVATEQLLHIHALLVGLFLLFAFLRAIIHVALHNVMPGIELVLRYEQILHTLQTAVDDGEKKYTAEQNATMGSGSKSAGDLIKIIFADFMPALLQVSISVALAATAEPLVGGIMLASGLTSFLVTRTQLRSQDGVRVGIARKKSHLDGSMTELLRGKPIVRTLNAVELEVSRVRHEATDLSKIERRHHRTMGFSMPEDDHPKHIWGGCCPTRSLSCDTRFLRRDRAKHYTYFTRSSPRRFEKSIECATKPTRRPFMFAKPSRYSTIRSIHTSFGRRLARMRRRPD